MCSSLVTVRENVLSPVHYTQRHDGSPRLIPGRRLIGAEAVFFPAAAFYGAAAAPLSVHGMLSGRPLLPGFASIPAHAHELLFGFALAVVAGFLITRISRARLSVLFGAWLVARGSFLVLPGSALALSANVAFAVLLGALVAPQFFKSAKKLRNQAFAPLLIAICAAALAFQFAAATGSVSLQFLSVRETVLLFALLMLFMGGRIIAPAAAGAIQRAGGNLQHRVQPRIEGSLLILMMLAIIALALPGGEMVTGALVLASAALALVRLLRWRLWSCPRRPDLWCLGVGYAWLVIGLALLGLSWTLQLLPMSTATHAITVGALGTLTSAVMLRVRLIRSKRDPSRARILPWITASIALAAVLRLAGGSSLAVLNAAAALWSLGMLMLLLSLLRDPKP
jgi:uncharacterized protein involved in response to NO